MIKFSTAQQFVSQILPNVTSGAVNIIQALQGNAGAGAEGAASKNAFGSSSLFDSELSAAKSPQAKTEDCRHEASKPVEVSRSREERARPDDKTPEVKPWEEEDRIYDTGGVQPLDQDTNTEQPAALSPATDGTSQPPEAAAGRESVAQSEPATSDPLIGSAGDVLAQAQDLLGQIEAFSKANPALANELQAIFAPIMQSLQQVISQLSALDVQSPVTASTLPAPLSAAFGKLDQFAQAFNRQLAGSAEGLLKLDAALQTDTPLPDEMLKAIQSLKQSDAKSMNSMNELAKSLTDFEAAISLAKSLPLNDKAAAASNAPTTATPPALNLVINNASDAAAAKASSVAITEGLATESQPGANQSSFNNNQNGQSQQQAFAAAQQAQQAQRALSGLKLSAESIRPAQRELGANPASSNTASAGQPFGAGSSSAVSGREPASFERALNQATKPSPSEQIQFQMKQMVKDGRSVMVVKLDPPELGQLEIKMQISRSGRTEVLISVEKPQTLEMLQKDSRLLTEALQDAGLKADGGSLSFNLQGGNDSPAGQQHPKNIYPAMEEQFDEQMLSLASETYIIDPEQGVNIHA